MQQTREEFTQLVRPGSGKLDGELDRAALLLAQAVDPTVDIEAEQRRLDELADTTTAASAAELAMHLFGGAEHDPVRHFSGNTNNYYDPDNSLLHRVLDRRVGIPISLSVLLIEIARRRDIHLHGVGMPGHFLVRSADGFIDPYHGGVMFDEGGCERLFRGLAGADAVLPSGSLDATPPAQVVRRMLFNLSNIGTTQQQRRILRAVRSLLACYPDADHRDHVQHAFAAAGVGQFHEAAVAAERALDTIPEQVHDKLQAQVDAWRARLN